MDKMFALGIGIDSVSIQLVSSIFTVCLYGGTFRTFIIFILENIFRGHV